MFIHPQQNRSLTPREAARIQSFPDWFRFPESRTQAFRLIGNAVPPLVAESLAIALKRVLRRDNVLRVPASALRFKPTAEIFVALKQPELQANGDAARVRAVRTGAPDAVRTPAAAPTSRAQLWAMKDGTLQSVPVRVGLSDGTLTELVDAPLEAGATVVTSVILPGAARAVAAPATSMFSNQGGGRGRF